MYVLRYDKYSTNFNGTISDLMMFLELEVMLEPPYFVAGKTYMYSYYKTEQRVAVLKLIRRMFNLKSRKLLERQNYGYRRGVCPWEFISVIQIGADPPEPRKICVGPPPLGGEQMDLMGLLYVV